MHWFASSSDFGVASLLLVLLGGRTADQPERGFLQQIVANIVRGEVMVPAPPRLSMALWELSFHTPLAPLSSSPLPLFCFRCLAAGSCFLGKLSTFPFSIMFTFAAFCYMLSLVLCVSLIFFAIWHVSTLHWVSLDVFFFFWGGLFLLVVDGKVCECILNSQVYVTVLVGFSFSLQCEFKNFQTLHIPSDPVSHTQKVPASLCSILQIN